MNSFADFYSWLRLGFSPIYLPQSGSVSEQATGIASVALSSAEQLQYLSMNRRLENTKKLGHRMKTP